MARASLRAAVSLALLLWVAGGAAGQGPEIHIHVHAVAPTAAYTARAIPAHVIVPQARSFVADPKATRIDIVGVTARVSILEQTATTTLDIDLRNPSSQRIEAELMIPLPEGAAVRSFTFRGPAPQSTAELLPKEAAMGIYHSVVASMKDPAILEFAGGNLVRSSLFPLEPYGTQRIRLSYEHLLPADGQRVDYFLPRTESLDYRAPWDVSVEIKSKSPISTVYSSTHKVEFRRGEVHSAVIHLAPEVMNEPGPLRLSYLRDGGEMVTASLFACPDATEQGGYFLLLAGLPASAGAAAADQPLRREVTVVLDRSGSMAGEKLDQAKAAALQVLEGLREGETFRVVDYSDYEANLSPEPMTKTAANMESARRYIRGLTSGGLTNLHDALVDAVRPQPQSGTLPLVIFLTDGLPTTGICDESRIRDDVQTANIHHRRIFTFGVGYDVNAPLLAHVAQHSRAISTVVQPRENIEDKVSQIYRGLCGPVIAGPELKCVGHKAASRVYDLVPRQPPDLFAGDQLIVMGRYRGAAPLRFRLSGNVAGKTRSYEFAFRVDRATTKNGFVPRLWATRKIAMLTEEIRQAGPDARPASVMARAAADPKLKERVDEIVRLSVEYGVLTEYTAFLDRQGTDLNARTAVVRQATENFVQRAQNTRSGMGAANQTMNLNGGIMSIGNNTRNAYVDQNMNRVETSNVQQVTNGSYFNRNGTWVEGAVANSSSPERVDRVIRLGTPEYQQATGQLLQENRQGALVVPGDIVVRINGQNVLLKNSGK